MSTTTLDQAKVAKTAFQLWEEDGRPHGRDQEHWFRAIEVLKAEAQPEHAPAPKTAAKRTPRAKAASAETDATAVKPAKATSRPRKTAVKAEAVAADAPVAKPVRARKTSAARAKADPSTTKAPRTRKAKPAAE